MSGQAVPPALRAWTSLVRAHAVTGHELKAQLQAEHGLTGHDYEALYLLARADGQRMKRVDLAERLMLTPSGVTRLLEGLEEEGLVKREQCETDLRISYAALTDAGLEKLEQASCGHEGSVRSVLERNLSKAEIEQLVSLLEKLPGGDDGASCPGV
jgi:DNA-binding MarR family transcriptional regulator